MILRSLKNLPVIDCGASDANHTTPDAPSAMKRSIRAASNATDYAKFYSLSHDAVIRVYDLAGNVIKHASQVAEDSKRLN
jgi:hypothetical protein